MPIITVQITGEKATTEQKQQIISDMTQTMVNVLGKDPATTFVIIEEVETDNWGVYGQSVTQLAKSK